MRVPVPAAVGLCVACVVLMASHPWGAGASGPMPQEAAVPTHLAGYSHLTGDVSSSPPGGAVALYQHGFGVEFLDFPQAVVMGAGGDEYRRVDVAEDRAGVETQGDPAPMLLSPDGTKVAVGDHDLDSPDVVIVDLEDGSTSSHPLPTGRSVVPVAWSKDGRRLANVVSPEPTNPHSGTSISGEAAVLDLEDDSSTLVQDGGAVRSAAFSPDGKELALQRAGTILVVDLTSDARHQIQPRGVLAGPAAWSPDGRLLTTSTGSSLHFLDPRGEGGAAVPEPLRLPFASGQPLLGWSGPDQVLALLEVPGADPCCGAEAYELVAIPLAGGDPRTLSEMTGLQNYGISRFQLASARTESLTVVSPAEVGRGLWPLPLRVVLTLLTGLLAWRVVRRVMRRSVS